MMMTPLTLTPVRVGVGVGVGVGVVVGVGVGVGCSSPSPPPSLPPSLPPSVRLCLLPSLRWYLRGPLSLALLFRVEGLMSHHKGAPHQTRSLALAAGESLVGSLRARSSPPQMTQRDAPADRATNTSPCAMAVSRPALQGFPCARQATHESITARQRRKQRDSGETAQDRGGRVGGCLLCRCRSQRPRVAIGHLDEAGHPPLPFSG